MAVRVRRSTEPVGHALGSPLVLAADPDCGEAGQHQAGAEPRVTGTIVGLLVLTLATWRLSHLVAREDGPGDGLRRLRIALGAFETIGAGWQSETFWGKLVTCPLCLSVWIGVALVALVEVAPWSWPAVYVLAVSGGACVLELALRRDL